MNCSWYSWEFACAVRSKAMTSHIFAQSVRVDQCCDHYQILSGDTVDCSPWPAHNCNACSSLLSRPRTNGLLLATVAVECVHRIENCPGTSVALPCSNREQGLLIAGRWRYSGKDCPRNYCPIVAFRSAKGACCRGAKDDNKRSNTD